MKPVFYPLVFAPALLLGCSGHQEPAMSTPPVVQAQLVKSVASQEPQGIQTTGTIHAKETATISAQVPGQIRQVLVQAGDRVRAGQLLVQLDDAGLRAALNQAQAAEAAAGMQEAAAKTNASLASETLTRYEMLQKEKSVSPQEFDEVQKRAEAAKMQYESYAAQKRAAEAAVAGARTQLGYTSIRAPFSGVVTARMADPGTLASPGVPLLQVDRDGPLQVYTQVDESLIGSVRMGMKIPVSAGGVDTLTGTVAEIVPAADPSSRSFLVKLDLPRTPSLRPGMYATASFPGAMKNRILAPQTAVTMRGSLACVYALDGNGVAQLRYVTLGNRHGDLVDILSGLSAGETLVNNPGDHDLAGKRIESATEPTREQP
jgi:RND family efflux transporter MFP subunit